MTFPSHCCGFRSQLLKVDSSTLSSGVVSFMHPFVGFLARWETPQYRIFLNVSLSCLFGTLKANCISSASYHLPVNGPFFTKRPRASYEAFLTDPALDCPSMAASSRLPTPTPFNDSYTNERCFIDLHTRKNLHKEMRSACRTAPIIIRFQETLRTVLQ